MKNQIVRKAKTHRSTFFVAYICIDMLPRHLSVANSSLSLELILKNHNVSVQLTKVYHLLFFYCTLIHEYHATFDIFVLYRIL